MTVTSSYRTTWGTIKVEFPTGMTDGNRQTAMDEMAAWERAPKRLIDPAELDTPPSRSKRSNT